MKKITALLLAVIMLISGGTMVPVLAAPPQEEPQEISEVIDAGITATIDSVASDAEGETISGSIVNPVYPNYTPEWPEQNTDTQTPENNQWAGDFDNVESAAISLRQHMVLRQPTFTFNYWMDSYSSDLANQTVTAILDRGFDASFQTAPNEGDYLLFHFGGGKYSGRAQNINGRYCMTVTMNLLYYTSATQEQAMDSKVQEVLNSLNLGGQSNHTKIRMIYDYVTSHVTYDYATLNDSTTGKFTAYNALLTGTAVCQGYASLMYRFLRETGIDCRVITSTTHAWNIVKQGSYYYNIDSTWDAGTNGQYQYFLKNMVDFEDDPSHYREAPYSSQEFYRAYPMAPKSLAAGDSGETPLTGGTWQKGSGSAWNYVLNGVVQKNKWIQGKDGDSEPRYVDAYGNMLINNYAFDGLYTYYMMANGAPMKNRLSWDPEGTGLIYFDYYGHMQFNEFRQADDGYIYYFGAEGRALRDQVTFWNNQAYYLDGAGRMQQSGWFQFTNGRDYGCANGDGTLMNDGFTYDPWGRVIFFHWNGMAARGLITDGTWYYLMDETDGHLVGQFQ